MPGGLNFINQNGQVYELLGNPGDSGTFSFTVQLNDGNHTTNKQYSLTISNAVQVTTTSLPNGTSGQGIRPRGRVQAHDAPVTRIAIMRRP